MALSDYDGREPEPPYPTESSLIAEMEATISVLRSALADNLQAWEGEEESVREEHADLIEETRITLNGTFQNPGRLEYAEKTMATLAKALQDIAAITTCEGTEAEAMAAQIQWIVRVAIGKAKGEV